jgi:osmotically-inducible protein OsmY
MIEDNYSRERDVEEQPERSAEQLDRERGQRHSTNSYQDEYSRSAPATGRERDDDQYYRGYYRRSNAPFRSSRGYGNLVVESWTLTGPYTGRGPKGYRRADDQILEEACRRLEQDGAIDASDIDVSCDDGVIRLAGTVVDRQSKRRAEDCVESVYGAKDVMNELRIKRESESDEGAGSPANGSRTSAAPSSGPKAKQNG